MSGEKKEFFARVSTGRHQVVALYTDSPEIALSQDDERVNLLLMKEEIELLMESLSCQTIQGTALYVFSDINLLVSLQIFYKFNLSQS